MATSASHHPGFTKKSGGLITCVNLRAGDIIPNNYALPTTEELTAQFHGSTVFIAHKRVFRYKRMAFGLTSAPSHFQKIIASIFAGVPGVAIYLDDTVVHRATIKSHDKRLHSVFSAMAKHHLTLNSEQCVFAAPAIKFVGFHLSADACIHHVPEPTSAAQVASFLAMIPYYLCFLTQYSATTVPLGKLLKHVPDQLSTGCSTL